MGQLAAMYQYCVHGVVQFDDADHMTMQQQISEASKLADAISEKEQKRVQIQQEIMRMSDEKGQPLPRSEGMWRVKVIDYKTVQGSIDRLLRDYRLWAQIAENSQHLQLVKGNQELYQKTKEQIEKLKLAISSHHDLPELHSEVDGKLEEHKKNLDISETANLTFKSLMDTGDVDKFSDTVRSWKDSDAHESRPSLATAAATESSREVVTKKKKKLPPPMVHNSSAP